MSDSDITDSNKKTNSSKCNSSVIGVPIGVISSAKYMKIRIHQGNVIQISLTISLTIGRCNEISLYHNGKCILKNATLIMYELPGHEC